MCDYSPKTLKSSAAGKKKVDGRVHLGLVFCQGAVTYKRKAELQRECTLEQWLDGEGREASGEARGRGGAPGIEMEGMGQWGNLSGRHGRMRTCVWNPDLRWVKVPHGPSDRM